MTRVFLTSLLLLFLPVTAVSQPAPDSGDVVINEILYAPSTSANEFIELYNRSEEAVELSRLEYADANRDFAQVAGSDTLLAPDQYVVIVRDSAAFGDAFPSVPALVPDGWHGLNNGGDAVILRDGPSTTIIDEVPYDPSWGGSDGNALERIDPDGPSTRAGNFGTSDATAGGTPGARNSIFDPDETPPSLTQVRSTRNGDSLRAAFSEPVDARSVAPAAFALERAGTPTVTTAAVSDTEKTQVICGLSGRLSTGSFTLVATDVADQQDNVQSETRASFRYFVPEEPNPKDLVITELHYAPSPTSSEFIEIYNRSQKIVDLGALRYADQNREFDRLAPNLTPIAPDSHAVIARDREAFTSTFPTVSVHFPDGWDALNNGGDTVVLRHAPSATTIDAVPYESSWGGTDGRSLERIDPAGPSDESSNFGSAVAAVGATPGARNSRFDPDEEPPAPVFAEQVADQTITVSFSEPLRPASVTPPAFALRSSRVTEVHLRRDTVASLSVNRAPTSPMLDVSGVQDRVGNELAGATIPIAFRPEQGQIIVNEILFDPRADDFDNRPNQVEYVEVLNRTDQHLSLRGLFVTDRPDEQGTADTVRAGRRRALSPRAFGIVAATPDGGRSASESQLAAAFPEAPLGTDSVAFLPVDARRLGLGNDGDLIRLHRADGLSISEVPYTPDWHAAGLEETKGTALERISASGSATRADNWTSSTNPTGGTPGQPNAVSLAPSKNPPGSGLTIEPSPFSVERDGATRIRYTLDHVPNLVRVQIFDARGRKVRSLEDARLTGRTGELVWNGRDYDGNRVRIGVYVVLFEAVRADAGTIVRHKEPVVVARPLN